MNIPHFMRSSARSSASLANSTKRWWKLDAEKAVYRLTV